MALSDLTGESGTQMALLDEGRDSRDRRLAGLVGVAGRLRARAGGEHVLYRLVSAAPWHPPAAGRRASRPAPARRNREPPIDTCHRLMRKAPSGTRWHSLKSRHGTCLIDRGDSEYLATS